MYKDFEGRTGRVITARIMPESDLLVEIKNICQARNIETAYINTCIGSMKKITFVYAVTDETQFYNIKYCDPVEMTGAIEFLSAQGIVAKDDAGEHKIHLHAQFSDEQMTVYGGHILEEGNIVLATIDLIITEVLDVNIKRNYHEASGFYFFEPA
jgi:hypothetical protein